MSRRASRRLGAIPDPPAEAGRGRPYADLYVEHAPAARRLALSMVPPDAADDIVAEAFARVLAAIRAGGGPGHAFRGYLLTTVRNVANDWLNARRRVTVIPDMEAEADDLAAAGGAAIPGISSGAEVQAEARAEARLIIGAFSKLPARWRKVLWQLEVEGDAPADVAPVFGLSANGVSALAMRAREGLRQAYLQEHIGTNIPEACRVYAAELGAGTRGRLSPRRQVAMEEHLRHCAACRNLFAELSELNSKLRTILAPIALAGSAAVGSSRHCVILRAGLKAQWRSWRLHPATAAAGAAAGVAVAGGMLFAVNVTPFTNPLAHAAVHAAAPAISPSGPAAGKRKNGGGSGGGPGGGGSPSGSGSPAAAGPGSGASSRAAAVHTPGVGSPAGTGPAAGNSPGSVLAAIAPPATAATGTVTGAANTAGAAVTGAANTAANTVNHLAGTAVTGAVNTVGVAVTGAASTASNIANAATGTVGTAITGAASTAGTAAGSVAATVAGVPVTSAVSTAAAAASNAVTNAAASTATRTALPALSVTSTPSTPTASAPSTPATSAANTTAATATTTAATATSTAPAAATSGTATGLAASAGGA